MKQLLIVAGHAGVGKSTYGKDLALKNNLALLDKNTLTQPFVESLMSRWMGDPHDRQSATYVDFVRPLEYTALMNTAWQMLESGTAGVIVTAPFVKELYDTQWVQELEDKCNSIECLLTIFWVTCDTDIQRKQITKRGAERDQWKLDNWDEWAASLLPAPSLVGKRYGIVENDGSHFTLTRL